MQGHKNDFFHRMSFILSLHKQISNTSLECDLYSNIFTFLVSVT